MRQGAEQGQVTAAFDVAIDHPARAILAANDIPAEDELILRRVQLADGRTRAFLNDQPVAVQVLRAVGTALVEIHGQHDDRALVDTATHRRLLDAYGGLESEAVEVARLWSVRRAAEQEVARHRAEVERARREADWLRHASQELAELAPEPGEETALAGRRTGMMQAEKVAEDLREAESVVAGSQSPVPMLAAAVRRLERRHAQAPLYIEPAVKALDAALTALDEARGHIEQALAAAAFDPRELERIEERLFALRAAGPQIHGAGGRARRAQRALCRRSRPDRRWRRPPRRAGKRGRGGRAALRHGGGRAVRAAPPGGRDARQGGERRAQAAQARAGAVLHGDRHGAGCAGGRGHRPRGILGAHQSRHAGRDR